MKTIFVTGGGGFIAGHVIEELLFRGIKVYTNIRSVSNDIPQYLENCNVYFIDNRDEAGIRSIVEKVDGVINLAGILGTKIKSVLDLDVFIDNNIKGSMSVIKACVPFNTPLVQIAVGNYFEHNWYSLTKTFIEGVVVAMAKYQGLHANVVRGLNAYGERQKVLNTGKIVPTFVTKALKNEPIQVYGGKDNCGIMDMIYVKDLACVLVDVMEWTITQSKAEKAPSVFGNVFEAGTGYGVSVYEIAEKIIKLSGSSSIIEEVPMRAGESERSKVIAKDPYPISKGITDMDEALKRTIEYYKNNQ